MELVKGVIDQGFCVHFTGCDGSKLLQLGDNIPNDDRIRGLTLDGLPDPLHALLVMGKDGDGFHDGIRNFSGSYILSQSLEKLLISRSTAATAAATAGGRIATFITSLVSLTLCDAPQIKDIVHDLKGDADGLVVASDGLHPRGRPFEPGLRLARQS